MTGAETRAAGPRRARLPGIALLVWLVPGAICAAGEGIEFSGYAVNLPVFQQISTIGGQPANLQERAFLDLTRLRLRPTLLLSQSASISLEHETTALYHSGAASLFSAPPAPRRQVVNMLWTLASSDHVFITHSVDRLYLRQHFSSGTLTVGRQRISWGTGRIWNPTDLFNPINPASFDKIEKDGADAVSYKVYAGDFTDIEAVYNPGYHFRSWNAAARFRTNFSSYDCSIMSGYFDKRLTVGGDFAGNLFDAGLRGEGILSVNKDHSADRYVRFIVGIDYQFTGRLYVLAEYLHNGEGKRERDRYEFDRLFSGELLNVGRDYCYLLTTFQAHPLVILTAGWNVNLHDGSGFFTPGLSYSLKENIDLQCGGLLTYGTTGSEYDLYPLSVYMKGTIFF